MPPAIPNQDGNAHDEGVQVRSSDLQRADEDVQQDPHSDSETEEDPEADLDDTTTPLPVATPATSRPTDTNEIKETPHHKPAAEDEDAPFSTAVDQQSGDSDVNPTHGMRSDEIELTGDVEIPGAGANGQRAGGSKTAPPVSRVLSFSQRDFAKQDGLQQDGLPQDDSQEVFASSPRLKNTYGKRSRRSTPAKNDELPAPAPDEQLEPHSDAPTIPRTSQALYPDGRPQEVAKRSLSGKRKATPEADEEGRRSSKARKVTPPDDMDEPAAADKKPDAADEESEDDGPSQIDAGPRVLSGSSGRLPRVARAKGSEEDEEEEEEGEEDEEDSAGEEIVAKPKKTSTRQKSSPNVVVRPQRASKSASKTPAGTPQTPNSTASSSLPGKVPKILVSNVTGNYSGNSALAKFIKAQGSSLVGSVLSRRTNFLCMVKDDKALMKTPKVLRSLALGKQVVTERWITESKAAGELLDPSNFIHQEVADTRDIDRRKLFFGKIVYFTNAAVKDYGDANWSEMKALVTEAGASSVESGTGDKGGKMTGRNSIIFFGTKPDKDATVLIEDYSRVVFHKDLIKEAVVSGELDLEDSRHKLGAGGTVKSKKTGRR